ncbi:ectoine/hydroxyectoine ABC transporter solute-binding protein [Solidesulfovibrio carbinoliphilus subsp. oakridgensis]|uniref:Ectoine/hydroxyectoine ABC transporter solute-binding protein n=1 Tax=Solidesulfovibrio carbinoliphilus subsp. oakridgensis TaxID=694327 RepID=G7Q4C5_9BACT|nr:ectoine/hydroxyectoine ABC transporter substrate-binding protein EhuB [Solidesulfovibrio carbinoliphilus]EHJ46993.1 ectoine/hydroxyectoine ABC transporter solute-binding protein [Solidesulfovibrio carbinoliphilus subsp. oakridgensis]
MRRILGYVAVTLLVAAAGLWGLLYVREGRNAPAPVWSGGALRIGYSSEPPYSYRTSDGKVTGEAPEIAKAVFDAMGVTAVRWVLLDFGRAIPALLDGQVDMLANGLFITPERSAQVLFSLPFCQVRPGLLVRHGNPFSLFSYEDVAARAEVTAAVLDGSVEQAALVRLGKPAQRLFVVPDPAAGLSAVGSGRADCLALSAPTVAWLAGETAGEVEQAAPFREPPDATIRESAFAFRPQDRPLAEAVNAALRRYIGSPQHRRAVSPFGFGPEALPGWSH